MCLVSKFRRIHQQRGVRDCAQLQGPSLVPFTVGKQVALQAALTPLLLKHLSVVVLRVERVRATPVPTPFFDVSGMMT